MKAGNNTIAAVATGAGGALAVVRLSGPKAVDICGSVFRGVSGELLSKAKGYTLHYGTINDGDTIVDDVIVAVFRAPHSYTGEDMAEISCHGSRYIQQEIVNLLIRQGVRHAQAGEFTVRAFLSGKIDLAQAEAVADMIASTDRATHALASNQMRGGYSAEFSSLRDELLSLVSLLELELDFGEEDVEFADRGRLSALTDEIERKISSLSRSFASGNVIKEGVAVAIAGSPNVGKSTLLNALLREDRAMVSEIPGTTRDVVEDSAVIDGVRFRFSDTAGLRSTDDRLEEMGIRRALDSIEKANIVLAVVEADDDHEATFKEIVGTIGTIPHKPDRKLIVVINKTDKLSDPGSLPANGSRLTDLVRRYIKANRKNPAEETPDIYSAIAISAKKNRNIDKLSALLAGSVDVEAVYNGETTVSNARHYEALLRAGEALGRVRLGLADGLATDLLAQDVRETLYHLGTITGEITTDEILGNIFSKFCIGK